MSTKETAFNCLLELVFDIEVCNGSCTAAGIPESQCESCADLEMRMMLGVIPDTRVLVPKS